MRLLILVFILLSGDVRLQPVKPETVICQSVDKFYQITEFFKYSEYAEVRHIILAVTIVESGWLNNQRHIDFNNYFSIKDFKHPECKTKPIMCLKQFESLQENLEYMLWYFSSKDYPIDKQGFMLKLEGYAEDELHTKKVKWVANRMRRVFKNINKYKCEVR
jgi:hypothetical protein